MKKTNTFPQLTRGLGNVVIGLFIFLFGALSVSQAQITINGSGSYATIQAAINAAADGDIIDVPAGTYTENLATPKSLTLRGANAGISAGSTPGVRGPETIIEGRIQFALGATDVTIDGFTINVPSANAGGANARLIFLNQALSGNFRVKNNILDGGAYSQSVGVYCSPSAPARLVSWEITNNSLSNFAQQAILLNTIEGNSTISGNNIANNISNPLITLGALLVNGVLVENNIFTNSSSSSNSITLNSPGHIISGNLFEGNSIALGLASSGSEQLIARNTFNNAGIGITATTTDNLVTENFFNNGGLAFRITTNAPGNVLYHNSFLNASTQSVQGNTNTVVTATCNWWGTDNPPATKVNNINQVIMAPWLISGTDSDLSTAGFQTNEVCLAPCDLQVATSTIPETDCANGEAAVAVTGGGTGTYSYTWTPGGATTPSISGLVAGTYSVTVRDQNGCTATANAVVANLLPGPVRNVTTGLNYCTIQAAVDAASPNDVIEVDAGVYNEALIMINKPLTIKGANAGISAGRYPGIRGPESIINGRIRTLGVNGNFILDGFTINIIANGTRALDIAVSGTATIKNNITNGAGYTGFAIGGIFSGNINSIFLVEDNSFNNFAQYGVALDGGIPTGSIIRGNLINNNGFVGLIIFSTSPAGQTIVDNRFVQNGTVLANGNNTVTRNIFEGTRIAVQVQSDNNIVTENIFANTHYALDVVGAFTGNKLNNNSILHTGLSVMGSAGSFTDATCNWWGTPTPPPSRVITLSRVDMAPWLTDGTDADLSTPGFQPSETCAAPCDVELSATPVDPLCVGGTGSVILSATGGTGNYTFSGYATTGLAPGNYSYTVTDANGCQDNTSATINDGTVVLSATVSSTPASCPGSSDGAISVSSPSGGSGNFEYRLDDNGWQSSGIFTGLTPGSYSVLIRDANEPSCVTILGDENVGVSDLTPPMAVCQNITVQLDDNGSAIITGSQVDGGSTDNCGITSLDVTPNTLTCADISGDLPTDLFISEYIEGTSNNKAIEIYNGTGLSVNLSDYQIRIFFNGSSSSASNIALAGTLANGGTYVVAHSSAAVDILTVANQTTGSLSFNGNDAVVLHKLSTNEQIDIFGRIGNDPGPAWTGTGGYTTVDRTLRRKPAVISGVTVNPSGTGPGAFTTLTTEWDIYPTNDFTGLGTHGITPGKRVTLTSTDGAGNSSTCIAIVNVEDITPPQITCPDDKVVNNTPNRCWAMINSMELPVVSDNCGVVSIINDFNNTNNANGQYVVGTTTVTWTATDASGNSESCSFDVTVLDAQAPVAVCVASITLQIDASGSAILDPADADGGSGDNCGIVLMEVSPAVFTCADVLQNPASDLFISEYIEGTGNNKAIEIYNGTASPIDLAAGGYQVRMYFNGNASPGTTINLTGVIAPGATHVLTTTTSAPELLALANQTSGASFYNGNDAVVLFKTSTSEILDIFGRIGEDPGVAWTAPGYTTIDRTLRRKPWVSEGVTTNPLVGFPSLATDWDIFPTNDFSGIGTHSSNNAPKQATLTVTDEAGNSSSCSFTVTVGSCNEPPVAVCQDITIYTDNNCQASIVAADVDGGSTDSDGDILSFSVDNSGPFGVGDYIVTLTVSDGEYEDQCTAIVTVEDNVPPIAICTDVSIDLAGGVATITAADVDGGSTDNCGIASLSVSEDTWSCDDIGIHTVTLTVTDVNGKSSSCDAVVEVEGSIPDVTISSSLLPNFCQGAQIILTATPTEPVTFAWNNGYNSDEISVFANGTYEVTVTNDNGCTNTASFEVTDYNVAALSSAYTIIATKEVHLHGTITVLNGGVGLTSTNSGDKLKLHDKSNVTGATTFVTGGNIEITGTSTATTQYNYPADIPLPPFVSNPYPGTFDVKVPDNATVTLADSVYKKIEIGKNATVTFTRPTVFAQEVIIRENATVKFSGCANMVIKKKILLEKFAKFNLEQNGVTVYIQDGGTVADFNEGVVFFGKVYAPAGDIKGDGGKVNTPIQLYGQFIGRLVEFKGFTTIDWDLNCDPSCYPAPAPECVCLGGINELTMEYSLWDNDSPAQATVTFYANAALTQVIKTFKKVTPGKVLKVSAKDLPGKVFGAFIYAVVAENPSAVIAIPAACGSDILGDFFRELYVYSQKDLYKSVCSAVDDCGAGKTLMCHAPANKTPHTHCVKNKDVAKKAAHPDWTVGPCSAPGARLINPTVVNAPERSTALESINEVLVLSNVELDAAPNPFNQSTRIRFRTPQDDFVRLIVFNVTGQEIDRLYEGPAEGGREYRFNFQARNQAPGMYFYRLETGDGKVHMKKLMLAR